MNSYIQQVKEWGIKAQEEETAGNYKEAYNLYLNCIHNFDYMMKHEQNQTIIKVYKEKLLEYLSRAERVKK